MDLTELKGKELKTEATNSAPSLTKEELALVSSYQEKAQAKLPLNALSLAETNAYNKWREFKSSEKVKGAKSSELLKKLAEMKATQEAQPIKKSRRRERE